MKCLVIIAIALTAASFGPQEPAKEPGPVARQEAFLAEVKAGEIDKAYEKLFKDTRFAAEADKLSDETEKGLSLYGDIAGVDNMGLVRQDKNQALGMGSLCCEQGPLNFYFTWYRKTEASPWKLSGFWFNDQVKEFWQFRK
jgi:hypothetical protein